MLAAEPQSPSAGANDARGERAAPGAAGAREEAAASGPSLLAALQRPRYEVLPLDGIAEDVLAHLPPGSKVTLTASPTQGLEATLTVAEALAPRDYSVVPHLSARLVRDRSHLEEIVARLRAVDVRDVFVIAGDARQPAGEYTGAVELLAAMGELRESFAELGISGYPESHHFISDETTIEAMFAKQPMATYIVSQICFDAATIATWVRRVRDRGTHLPIWIGVPGAVDTRKLMRTSLRIGLGESVRFLRAQRGLLRRFLSPRRYTPTDLLEQLSPTFAEPGARVGGIHVYTFNELKETETWRRQLVDRLTN
ncbi:MAG TPA: methylenetetrahydrofolate reductase [Thermoleophilaceae bacterium]|nr:methylenetetrahydrofolate reductase [Thermoleophilaceae bacterium]